MTRIKVTIRRSGLICSQWKDARLGIVYNNLMSIRGQEAASSIEGILTPFRISLFLVVLGHTKVPSILLNCEWSKLSQRASNHGKKCTKLCDIWPLKNGLSWMNIPIYFTVAIHAMFVLLTYNPCGWRSTRSCIYWCWGSSMRIILEVQLGGIEAGQRLERWPEREKERE